MKYFLDNNKKISCILFPYKSNLYRKSHCKVMKIIEYIMIKTKEYFKY